MYDAAISTGAIRPKVNTIKPQPASSNSLCLPIKNIKSKFYLFMKVALRTFLTDSFASQMVLKHFVRPIKTVDYTLSI